MSSRSREPAGSGRPKTPNLVLRRIREQERRETRQEFADAMAGIAHRMGESVCPTAQYVERLESGQIQWPRPLYRRILMELCDRPLSELGFTVNPGISPLAPDDPDTEDSGAQASAAAQGKLNRPLRDAVVASGMEMTDIARRVGVAPKSAQRWIMQGRIPHPRHRWKLCEILGRQEHELWPSLALPDQAISQLEIRRSADTGLYNRVLAGNGGEDVVDVLSRIQELHRGAVHPEIVSHLQENLRHTVAQYEKLDHASLMPALLKQRAWIDAVLGECSHPGQRQELFEIAGATSGVLGYVAVGRGDFPLARAYCLEAFQLGDFAEDANLQAWARGMQSFCEYYAGRYDEAVRLAEDGLNYAQSGPQSVRLTVNGVARAMGKLGDAEGVHRAVGEAYDLMSRNDVPDGVPSSIAFECYSTAQTASNAATAYVSLGMAEKVQHYIGLALPDISASESPWSRSLVMIDHALSLIRSKETDLDRAAELVLDAVTISADRPIISVQQRTAEFVRDAAGRWGNIRQISAVRDAVPTLLKPR